MIRKLWLTLILCIIPLTVFPAVETHWVDTSGGAANWAACVGEADVGAGNRCTLAQANAGAVDGNTVILSSGTYNRGIYPANSGTGSGTGRIIFQAATKYGPILNGTGVGSQAGSGIYISGKNWIKIDGVTVKNCTYYMMAILNSDYVEITNSEIYNSTRVSNYWSLIDSDSDHTWFHDNIVHDTTIRDACADGTGLMQIGQWTAGHDDSDYTTIEDNIFYHGGHHTLQSYSHYNIIRNNVFHNEGFRPYPGGTVTISQASPGVVTQVGHPFITGDWIRFGTTGALPTGIVAGTQYSIAKIDADTYHLHVYGTTTDINTSSAGSGVHDSRCTYDTDPDNTFPGDRKYAHRNLELQNITEDEDTYVLIENNRLGYASANGINNGSEQLTLTTDFNIVRYNDMFGGDGPGIYFKSIENTYPRRNRIYNNTITDNGRYAGTYESSAAPQVHNAIYVRYSASLQDNQFKNNLIYNSPTGATENFSCAPSSYTCSDVGLIASNNWCVSADSGICSATGDPEFTSYPTITQSLIESRSKTSPDLTLQATSTAIDGGTYLTQANGAGVASTTLIVDDARYFQDGTWGSSLSTVAGDWIAIGAVDNVHEISAINYAMNTITLALADTWADNATIWLYKDSSGNVVLAGTSTDYGAHEYNGTPESDVTAPTFLNASIDATGKTLSITLNENAIVNDNTGFALTCDGAGDESLTYVGVAYAILTYTITKEVQQPEVCTVAYTSPGANSIEDPAGNDLASFTSQAITNESTQNTPPLVTLTMTSTNATTVSTPSGINCGSDCTEDFDSGTTVTLLAVCPTNYQNPTITGTGCGTSTIMSEARSCTATCIKISADATIGSGAAVTIGSGAAVTIY
jgi:hypothetical protein